MTREIPLSHGLFAIVDEQDFARLTVHRWRAVKASHAKTWYAVTGRDAVPMHHMVLPPAPGLEVDHRDRNGLNNRRANLRQATRHQNAQNRSYGRARPGFRGAYPRGQRWRAAIVVNGQQVSLGFYATEIEAARAYDEAAAERFGEFAVLNFAPDRDWLFGHEHAGIWPPKARIEDLKP